MIVLGIFGGIAAVAVGLVIADLLGKEKTRNRVDARAIDINERDSSKMKTGEWFPPPGEARYPSERK